MKGFVVLNSLGLVSSRAKENSRGFVSFIGWRQV